MFVSTIIFSFATLGVAAQEDYDESTTPWHHSPTEVSTSTPALILSTRNVTEVTADVRAVPTTRNLLAFNFAALFDFNSLTKNLKEVYSKGLKMNDYLKYVFLAIVAISGLSIIITFVTGTVIHLIVFLYYVTGGNSGIIPDSLRELMTPGGIVGDIYYYFMYTPQLVGTGNLFATLSFLFIVKPQKIPCAIQTALLFLISVANVMVLQFVDSMFTSQGWASSSFKLCANLLYGVVNMVNFYFTMYLPYTQLKLPYSNLIR